MAVCMQSLRTQDKYSEDNLSQLHNTMAHALHASSSCKGESCALIEFFKLIVEVDRGMRGRDCNDFFHGRQGTHYEMKCVTKC